jgi:hypothetical protein
MKYSRAPVSTDSESAFSYPRFTAARKNGKLKK